MKSEEEIRECEECHKIDESVRMVWISRPDHFLWLCEDCLPSWVLEEDSE